MNYFKHITLVSLFLFSIFILKTQAQPAAVKCNDITTEVVEVINPTTGKIWMDRNIGAQRVAERRADSLSFGDLYQWGRYSDGHQCRNSQTTTNLASSLVPNHNLFIVAQSNPYNWLKVNNENLWQGEAGINNPCPTGFRIPTGTEFLQERNSWDNNTKKGAFKSLLKLPLAGYRRGGNGLVGLVGMDGMYWTSEIRWDDSRALHFSNNTAGISNFSRSFGISVRCIKSQQ